MKYFKLPNILLSLLLVVSSFSNAAIITEWGFEVDSGFTEYEPAASITTDNVNAFWNAPSTLSWGTGASGQSSFDVGGATNGNFVGSLFTDGAAVDTVTVTHNNNPITGTTLGSATLSDRIFLTPLDGSGTPVGPGFAPPNLLFDIVFEETLNSGTCAVPTSPTPCNDIFVLDIENAGFDTSNNSLNQNFEYDGQGYTARLFIAGVGVLGDAACAAAGSASGCIGFTTVEGQENTFQVVDITTRTIDVPEPGIIAILALGLLSLSLSRKAKQ